MTESGAAPPLRLAVITSDDLRAAWPSDALTHTTTTVATVGLHIVARPANTPPHATGFARPLRDRLRPRRLPAARGRPRHPLAAPLAGVPTVEVTIPATSGVRHRMPAAAQRALARAGCDVVVNLSGVALAGPDAKVVRHGLWEHRVAAVDGRHLTRPLVALRPVLLELCLVRVGAALADDTVLQRGWVASVPRSLGATVATAGAAVRGWLARTCIETIRAGAPPRRRGAPPSDRRLFADATTRATLSSPVRTCLWAARQVFRQEEWSIGVVDTPIEVVYERGVLDRPRWLRNPSPRCYLADPFGVPGSDTILAESYHYLRRRGDIVAVHTNGADRRTSTTRVIESDGHASYPYLFEADGDLYCVPETSDQRRATLYRATVPESAWERVTTLVDDMGVVDPTIVEHEGRWWLFCTDIETGEGSNLCVFHADALAGPWRPHRLNPVKVDVRSARGAGTPFIVDGTLIRPGQDNHLGYGSAVVFNEITRLTPDAFEERSVRRIAPQATGRYRSGFHTVSAWGDRTLVDGKHAGLLTTVLLGRLMSVLRRSPGTGSRTDSDAGRGGHAAV